MSARGLPRILAVAVAAALVLAAHGCGDDGDEADPREEGAGGGGGVAYESPKRITEGDEIPPDAFNIPNVDLGPIEPMNVGGVINGIEIIDPGANAKGICPGELAVSGQAVPFELGYLPPNTFELSEPRVLECPDGQLESAHRDFLIGMPPAGFAVSYARLAGPPAASGTGPVRGIEVGGVKGVLVEPQVHQGTPISQTQVVLPTNEGSVVITSNGLATETVLKIAEGFSCEKC